MQLHVESIHGEELCVLEASPNATVLSLQKRLRAPKEKLPRLVFESAALRGDSSLALAGLQNESRLQLVRLVGAPQPPPFNRSHTDVLDARPPAKDVTDGSLAGCRSIEGALPSGLNNVDIRQCRMDVDWIEREFAKMPAGLESLRASRNAISPAALHKLAETGCALRVLDIGCSDLDEDADELALPDVRPLVGQHTEELGLGDVASSEMLLGLVPLMPRLKRIDMNWAAVYGEAVPTVWDVLSNGCPLLEELLARAVDCPAESVKKLVERCPALESLVLGCGAGEGLAALQGRHWKRLDVEVQGADELAAAARLEVDWLVLRSQRDEEGELFMLEDTGAATTALTEIAAQEVELHLSIVTADMMAAVGGRLRVVAMECIERGLLLPQLARVAAQCQNLLSLETPMEERISAEALIAVAASCPLLQSVHLNADDKGLQQEFIDEGVLALGRHCAGLRRLDLFLRRMRDAVATLATACQGWPELKYLCAHGTLAEGERWTPQLRLPEALAQHCPLLEELELCPVPEEWRPILEAGCPLLKSVFGPEKDSDEDEEEVVEEDEEDGDD